MKPDSIVSMVRKDLLSEFAMPRNTPYLRLAAMLIQARYWMVSEPPKTREDAFALLLAEVIDREARLSYCI